MATAAAAASADPNTAIPEGELPLYEVLEPSYIGEAYREPGAVVRFDGVPGPNLAPVKGNRTAEKAKKDAVASGGAGYGIRPGHPQFVAETMRRAVQEGPAQGVAAKA